jgi:AcrR family transcriptional regulator
MVMARTRNPEDKRQAIIAAGEHIFAEQGFERARMQDIARAAGVAVGTVYRMFPDKPSLLAALFIKMEEDFIAAMIGGWNATPRFNHKFDHMIAALLDELERVHDKMPLYLMTKNVVGATAVQPGARVMQAIDQLYSEAVAAGVARAFPNGYQAAVGHAMIEGAFRAWMADPTPARRAVVETETQALFRRAFLL